VSVLLSACTQANPRFLLVQVCLADQAELDELIADLRSLAAAERMAFEDTSESAKRGLAAVGHPGVERTRGSPVVEVSVYRADGMGVTAGNLGLPGYQIALGFTDGRHEGDGRLFANSVVKRLEQRWRVVTVPDDRGALPLPDCN